MGLVYMEAAATRVQSHAAYQGNGSFLMLICAEADWFTVKKIIRSTDASKDRALSNANCAKDSAVTGTTCMEFQSNLRTYVGEYNVITRVNISLKIYWTIQRRTQLYGSMPVRRHLQD